MAEPATLTEVHFINNFWMQTFIQDLANLCTHLGSAQSANETKLTTDEAGVLKQATSSLKLELTGAFHSPPINLLETNHFREACPTFEPTKHQYPNNKVYQIYRYAVIAYREMIRCPSSLRNSSIHENDWKKGVGYLDVIDVMIDAAVDREFVALPQATPKGFVPDARNTGGFSEAQKAAAAASSSG